MQVRTRTWFTFVVAAAAIFLLGSRFAVFDPLENATLSFTAPIESGLSNATRPVATFVNNLTDVSSVSDKNQALTEENERLKAQVVRLQDAEAELQQLQQQLKIRQPRGGDAFVAAKVFAREPSNSSDVIAIDRGTSDGLTLGMIALTRQGSLIGTVTEVLDDVAWVTLISDPTSAVSATVQASKVQGIVAGSTDGTLTMEFVDRTADVARGDLVVTSAVGGSYPPGELVGEVVDVGQTPQELFKSVTVQPLADLSNIESVIVLTSFEPAQAPRGQP
jgi:rod shape-determining protein MreC